MIDAEKIARWRMKLTGAALAGILLLSTGCATNPDGTTEYKRTATGALAGGAVGAGSESVDRGEWSPRKGELSSAGSWERSQAAQSETTWTGRRPR